MYCYHFNLSCKHCCKLVKEVSHLLSKMRKHKHCYPGIVTSLKAMTWFYDSIDEEIKMWCHLKPNERPKETQEVNMWLKLMDRIEEDYVILYNMYVDLNGFSLPKELYQNCKCTINNILFFYKLQVGILHIIIMYFFSDRYVLNRGNRCYTYYDGYLSVIITPQSLTFRTFSCD